MFHLDREFYNFTLIKPLALNSYCVSLMLMK